MIKTSDQFLYKNETIIRIITEYLGMIAGSYIAWKGFPKKTKIDLENLKY